MKKNLLLITLFTTISIFSQKLYIWCPPEQKVKPRKFVSENLNIDVVIFDGRVIPNRVRDKCDPETLKLDIANYLKKLYPTAKINILSEEYYYKKAESDKITLKIGISAYHAGFGTDVSIGIGSVGGNFAVMAFPKGEWNALTSYYIQTFDLRNNEEKKQQIQISELDSKSNMMGYSSAKSALFNTYQVANQKLGLFVDGVITE